MIDRPACTETVTPDSTPCCMPHSLPVVSSIWSLELALVGALVAVGVANLPDLDEPLPWLQHRGPTHTVWFAVLVGLIAGVGTRPRGALESGRVRVRLVVGTGGILAHLAGDIVTPMGISPFAPRLASPRHARLVQIQNGRINRAFLLAGSAALFASLLLTVWLPTAAVPTG